MTTLLFIAFIFVQLYTLYY
ncbi:MAG: hypothetical protein E7206_01930 [Clostridium beijerinckii]|nr:hypothetical protein [Clostridium beijerinckii]